MRQSTVARPLHEVLRRSQLFITVAVLVICGIDLALSNWFVSRAANRAIGEATASILTRNLVAPLLFRDIAEQKKTLSSIENHPVFSGIVLRDQRGQVLLRYPETLDLSAGAGDRFVHSPYSYNIVDNGDDLGSIILIPRQSLNLKEILFVSVGIILALFAAYLFSGFASGRIRDTIVRQFETVLVAAGNILGREDYSGRVPEQIQDDNNDKILEIQNLTASLNSMLELIESRGKAISELNSSLELKVEQRTAELKEAQMSLVQSSRLTALGEMAAGLAHEINNPLAAISGKVRAITRSLKAITGGVPEEVASDLAKIDATTERIEKIIHGLRALSRDGTADPYERVKLNLILDDALNLCANRLKSRGIRLDVEPIDSDIEIECRPTQLGQVLLNLLNNAGDAIEKLETKWIKVSAKTTGTHVVLSISDSGLGIPESIRSKLMEPFFTTKEVGKGTGLGLSISKKIVESHGGTLQIDAASPNTCFVVSLPLTHG